MKMNDWRADLEHSLQEFAAARGVNRDLFRAEHLLAPHRSPSRLPLGKMAVYGFWLEGWGWLKIGKAGPNSSARYAYQHYNGCAGSTLARSLQSDLEMPVFGWDLHRIGEWIKENCCRVNLITSSQMDLRLLAELEGFLHRRLKPRYEGR